MIDATPFIATRTKTFFSAQLALARVSRRSNSIQKAAERKADERLINDNDGAISGVINLKQVPHFNSSPYDIRGRAVRLT